MKYAAQTTVSVEKSRAEIETTVMRYGAKSFSSGWKDGSAAIMFEMRQRHIRFVLPLPLKNDPAICSDPRKPWKRRTDIQIAQAWEQACRQRWRALALAVKAKLEAVDCGISEFDYEFMANIVTRDGKTIGEHIAPRLPEALAGKLSLGYTPNPGGQ